MSAGRGWAVLTDDAGLDGHLFFHLGDESGFRAESAQRHDDGAGIQQAVSHQAVTRLREHIESVFDPGTVVFEDDCAEFVDDLRALTGVVAQLIPAAPSEAVALYELLIACCYEKSDEVDDSSGDFGDFARSVLRDWVNARQAAGTDADETVTYLLNWMDDDPYGFCHELESDVSGALDEEGLTAMVTRMRKRLNAAAR